MVPGFHHVEVWVVDFDAVRAEWAWLLTQMEWTLANQWPGGESWAAGGAHLTAHEFPEPFGGARPSHCGCQPPRVPRRIRLGCGCVDAERCPERVVPALRRAVPTRWRTGSLRGLAGELVEVQGRSCRGLMRHCVRASQPRYMPASNLTC